MTELTREDAIDEARKDLAPIRKEQKKRTEIIFKNIGTIVTISIIALSMILFAYNSGFSSVYNLPATALSLDISRFIPIAVQLMGIIGYAFMYISSVLTDRLTNHIGFSLTRVLLCSTICSWFVIQNDLKYALGHWCILGIIGFPILLELILLWVHKRKNKPVKNQVFNEESFEYKKREFISNAIFPYYSVKLIICIVAAVVCISPLFGMINASTKREYQVFRENGYMYAVIADNSDTFLVQKAEINNDTLEIETDKFYYYPKESQELFKVVFKDVTINKRDNKKILKEIQASIDQI